MIKRIAAVMAGAALAGGAALAQADTTGSRPGSPSASSDLWRDTGKAKPGTETSSGAATGVGTGGSGTATQGQAQVSGTLEGTVVKSPSNDLLFVQHMGAIVPVQVSKSTTLLGLNGKKLSDLRDGDQVTVSFQVKNRTQNVATSVQLLSGTGGAGYQDYKGYEGMGTHEQSRGGRQTAVPDRDPMAHPKDVNNPPVTPGDQPIY